MRRMGREPGIAQRSKKIDELMLSGPWRSLGLTISAEYATSKRRDTNVEPARRKRLIAGQDVEDPTLDPSLDADP